MTRPDPSDTVQLYDFAPDSQPPSVAWPRSDPGLDVGEQ